MIRAAGHPSEFRTPPRRKDEVDVDGTQPSTTEVILEWIGEHPKTTLITSLTMGVTLGWLIKRR